MPFPASDRVLYDKNPLTGVICQLRFPPILKIAAQPPVEYQEIVRHKYPLFEDRPAADSPSQNILMQSPQEIVGVLLNPNPPTGYDFLSADKQWIVTLTREFIALTCSRYKRWEDFNEHLVVPLDALVAQYSPTFYSRIGLRYQNVIQKSKLGIEEVPWAELLNPYIAGEIAAAEISKDVVESTHIVLVTLEKYQARVRIQHGFVKDNRNGEICYLIDCDFFTEQQTELKDARSILDYFNEQNRWLFQWIITKQLHDALGPTPVRTR